MKTVYSIIVEVSMLPKSKGYLGWIISSLIIDLYDKRFNKIVGVRKVASSLFGYEVEKRNWITRSRD